MKFRKRYFHCKFLRFWYVFLDAGFQSFLKVFSADLQIYFESWHKVASIAWTDITLMFLLQYLDMFLLQYLI